LHYRRHGSDAHRDANFGRGRPELVLRLRRTPPSQFESVHFEPLFSSLVVSCTTTGGAKSFRNPFQEIVPGREFLLWMEANGRFPTMPPSPARALIPQ